MTFSQISLGADRTNTNETSSCENLYSSRIWKYQVAVNNQMGKCEEILEDKTETWTEALQHLELTIGPVLMICGFLAKLLRQVIQSLQTADLSQKPLLISFLRLLQALPCSGNVLRTKWKIKKITKQNWLSSNTNNDKDSGTAHKYNWDYLIQDWDLLRSWLTDTILPSEGMNAGRLLMRSLVWRVLKLISSWHFSCTLGGLCWRL